VKTKKRACPFSVFISKNADGEVDFRYDSLDHNHRRQLHKFVTQGPGGETKKPLRVSLERGFMHPDIVSKYVEWVRAGTAAKDLKRNTLKASTNWSQKIIRQFPYTESEDYMGLVVKRVGSNIGKV
jgi:hypothetical protein